MGGENVIDVPVRARTRSHSTSLGAFRRLGCLRFGYVIIDGGTLYPIDAAVAWVRKYQA
jgi:hypothetical protein